MSSACIYPHVVTPADLSCLTFENKSHNENKEVENGVRDKGTKGNYRCYQSFEINSTTYYFTFY